MKSLVTKVRAVHLGIALAGSLAIKVLGLGKTLLLLCAGAAGYILGVRHTKKTWDIAP